MGYCYEGGKLCCDKCDEPGARKRPCKFRVRYPEGGSLPYCPAPALCTKCYEEEKPTLHNECAEGARKAQAEEDEKARLLNSGAFLLRTCWGDWLEGVPKGHILAKFVNKEKAEQYFILPETESKNVRKRFCTPDDFPSRLESALRG